MDRTRRQGVEREAVEETTSWTWLLYFLLFVLLVLFIYTFPVLSGP